MNHTSRTWSGRHPPRSSGRPGSHPWPIITSLMRGGPALVSPGLQTTDPGRGLLCTRGLHVAQSRRCTSSPYGRSEGTTHLTRILRSASRRSVQRVRRSEERAHERTTCSRAWCLHESILTATTHAHCPNGLEQSVGKRKTKLTKETKAQEGIMSLNDQVTVQRSLQCAATSREKMKDEPAALAKS